MALRRRLELLNWAQAADAFVLEDDYDSEYRYAGRPLTLTVPPGPHELPSLTFDNATRPSEVWLVAHVDTPTGCKRSIFNHSSFKHFHARQLRGMDGTASTVHGRVATTARIAA